MINIVIVDDHSLVGEGTKSILSKEPDFNVEFIGSSVEFIEKISDKLYDVYLIDLHMPEINGLQLTKEIIKTNPEAKVVIFTAHDISSHFNQFVESGVSGFISKECSSEDLVLAIRSSLKGKAIIPLDILTKLKKNTSVNEETQIKFTQKEEDILLLVTKGLSNAVIADDLFLSQRSVERYLTSLFKKLDVNSRIELIDKAKELKIVPEFTA
ncbi:MAG: response regulator transcription factor [Bacillaceae bacterium]|nr:response regulator transcription factor [Bacillaceae bacterium]